MSVICYMSVICLVLGGVVRVRLYIIYAHLCNHILLQSGWWDLGHSSVHCGGVGSGSRDVDAWLANGCTPRIGGYKYRWPWNMVPSPPAANPRRGLIRGSDIGLR